MRFVPQEGGILSEAKTSSKGSTLKVRGPLPLPPCNARGCGETEPTLISSHQKDASPPAPGPTHTLPLEAGGSHHAVLVYGHAVFLEEVVDVRPESFLSSLSE